MRDMDKAGSERHGQGRGGERHGQSRGGEW